MRGYYGGFLLLTSAVQLPVISLLLRTATMGKWLSPWSRMAVLGLHQGVKTPQSRSSAFCCVLTGSCRVGWGDLLSEALEAVPPHTSETVQADVGI